MKKDDLFKTFKSMKKTYNLSDELLNELINKGTIKTFKKNEIVIEQNTINNELYLIISGEAVVTRLSRFNDKIALIVLQPGEFLGAIAVFDDFPMTNTISAAKDLSVLAIAKKDLLNFKYLHEYLIEITKVMAYRMRDFDDKYILEVEEHQNNILQTEKLSTIGRMLAGLLHDFKFPISVISTAASLMAETGKLEKKQKYLNQIKSHIVLFNSMVSNILDFSKGKTSVMRHYMFSREFIEEIEINLYEYFKDSKIKVNIKCDFEGKLYIDENQINRVFHNLIKNAAESMNFNGEIQFIITKCEENIVFKIIDEGPGIPNEIKDKLFKSFSTHGKKEGTGLGLAISKKIIDEHKGSISCESNKEKGTTFTITIPFVH